MLLSLSRVQVLELNQKEDTWALDNVLVKFIDEGRTGLVSREQLWHLPEQFHALPPQAVEFIVCRVKPADNEVEWNPKVSVFSCLFCRLLGILGPRTHSVWRLLWKVLHGPWQSCSGASQLPPRADPPLNPRGSGLLTLLPSSPLGLQPSSRHRVEVMVKGPSASGEETEAYTTRVAYREAEIS